jgi:hypothetical protein
MFNRVLIALVVFGVPAVADSRLFHQIRKKDAVTLVVPKGECGARVVSRSLDQLTLRLNATTDACGASRLAIVLLRADVQDVVDNRRESGHDPRRSRPGACAAAAMGLVGAPGALAVGAATESGPVALLVLFGSGVAGAALCRERGARYTVFSERITPAQP